MKPEELKLLQEIAKGYGELKDRIKTLETKFYPVSGFVPPEIGSNAEVDINIVFTPWTADIDRPVFQASVVTQLTEFIKQNGGFMQELHFNFKRK